MVADLQLEDPLKAYFEERKTLLKDIGWKTVRKAWFSMSHLLLDEDAHVLDVGCADGAMTYAMAVIFPHIHFTGLDKDKRKISKASTQYERPNLDFKIGDTTSEIFEPGSLDAIINSFTLHTIFSNARYNERIVNKTLDNQFRMLKDRGQMFIRDFVRPPPEEFVLMEMPDEQSTGDELNQLSEADLLLWYAEHARPRQDPGCGGFFIEELPPRFPDTRLFRLPYKWAYEFVMRKDDREQWERELPMEYTFFTSREFRKALHDLGARVQYSAPHYDDNYIQENFENKFKLFADDGAPLDYPSTSFVAVARKMSERKSLYIEERRPSKALESSLSITAVRDTRTGALIDTVSRNIQVREILPYRVDENGRLKVYLHDGIARSIANAVPRSGINIGQRQWSAHMIEAIAVNADTMENINIAAPENAADFMRTTIGLKPQKGKTVEEGPDFYPSPDYINERIFTFYVAVEKAGRANTPKNVLNYAGRFQAKGQIREMDAQQILNAIAVGMIPNARLELQILALFQKLGIKAENWNTRNFSAQVAKITANMKVRDILRQLRDSDQRFKDVKGTAGQLRPVQSTFVEEGRSRGARTGLSAEDVDFVVHEEKTINTAVVLPVIKSAKNDLFAGFLMPHLPVPQRFTGKGVTMSAPSVNLPPGIISQKMAKAYLAEKFGVLPDMVFKLGESYYTHLGLTPQRVHPYAIATPPDYFKDPNTFFMPFHQLMIMGLSMASSTHFMVTVARSFRALPDQMRYDMEREASLMVGMEFMETKPKWSLPLTYEPAPYHTDVQTPDPAPINAPNLQDVVRNSAPAPSEKETPQMIMGTQTVRPGTAPEQNNEAPAAAPSHTPVQTPANDIEYDESFSELEDSMEPQIDGPKPEKW